MEGTEAEAVGHASSLASTLERTATGSASEPCRDPQGVLTLGVALLPSWEPLPRNLLGILVSHFLVSASQLPMTHVMIGGGGQSIVWG